MTEISEWVPRPFTLSMSNCRDFSNHFHKVHVQAICIRDRIIADINNNFNGNFIRGLFNNKLERSFHLTALY